MALSNHLQHFHKQILSIRCRICDARIIDFDYINDVILELWMENYPKNIPNNHIKGCLTCKTCFHCKGKEINPITQRKINVGGSVWEQLIKSHKITNRNCCYPYYNKSRIEFLKEKKEKTIQVKREIEKYQPTLLNKEIIHKLDSCICNDVTGLIVSYLLMNKNGDHYDMKKLRKCDHFWCSQWTGCCMCSHPNDLCPSCKNHT